MFESSQLRVSYLDAIERVIRSKVFVLGERLEKFEQTFANFISVKYAIGVASGTDALQLCLRALDVKHGDSVLTVAFTSPFTAIGIAQEGVEPIFCDIENDTLNIDLKDARLKIKKNTKAVIPVHIFGNPCDMEKVSAFAEEFNLKIIEDACQAHGAQQRGKFVGNFGDAAAFSFYPTKNLGGFGDGGIVVTNNRLVAKSVRLLRNGGQTKRFWHVKLGINSRLDELQAAVLQIKIKKLAENNKKRASIAKHYEDKLSSLPITFQKIQKKSASAYNLFVIRVKKQKELQKFLANKQIETGIYYSYPVHLQPAFDKYKSKLPVTEKVCREILALPIYPELDIKSQDLIIKAICEFFKK